MPGMFAEMTLCVHGRVAGNYSFQKQEDVAIPRTHSRTVSRLRSLGTVSGQNAQHSLALSAHGAWVDTIELYAHLPNVGLFFTLWTSLDGGMPPSCPQPWPQCEPAFGLSLL